MNLICFASVFAKGDFLMERDRLQKRYESFYQRVQEKKRKDLIRQGMAEAHKQDRQKREKTRDALRRSFVRRIPEAKERERLLHEEQLKELSHHHENLRLKYIKERKELKKIKKESMMIPPAQDVGLEDVN